MATVSRGTKAYGGTAYQSSKTLLASELEADFNPIISEINGNLEDVNVKTGANIDPSKIGDHSVSAAEMFTVASTGDSESASLATTLEGELERIRYAIERLSIGYASTGSHAVRKNATIATTASWAEPPVRAHNLATNGGFDVWDYTAGLPLRWAQIGSCAITQQATIVTEGTGKMIRITASAAAVEGISQTFASLKSSTKYMAICRAKSGAATYEARMEVTGAITSGGYQGIATTNCQTTAAAFTTLSCVFQTDATPTNIVVRLVINADAGADFVDFDNFALYELNDYPIANGGNVVVRSASAAALTYTAAAEIDTTLKAEVTVPGPGYQILVTASLPFLNGAVGSTTMEARLKENGSVVQMLPQTVPVSAANSVSIEYAVQNPTPGTTYTYTLFGYSNAQTCTHYSTSNKSLTATLLRCG